MAQRPTDDEGRPPLSVSVSRHFLEWMDAAQLSLAFTTYQTNRLFLVGLKPDGRLSVFERLFDRPMGLCVSPTGLVMSTRWQLWELDDALADGGTYEDFDRLYVPRRSHTTGEVDAHDIAVDSEGHIVFVNTAYSCLAAVSGRFSFRPIWQPSFISKLVPEDRCHLNGLAMREDRPAFVSAISLSDVATGWRDHRHDGGVIIDVDTGEIVCSGLSMPHSPRLYAEKLWVLNSGTGELGWVDTAKGRFEAIAFCPGYVRGLCFVGNFAIVGLSRPRRDRAFAGLELDDRLTEKHGTPRCGIWMIDLRSGAIAHWLELEGVVSELYDVQVLTGIRRPMALGFKSDEIRRVIAVETLQGPVLHSLATSRARRR